MAERDRPSEPKQDAGGGAAADNSPLRRQAPAGSPGAGPSHSGHDPVPATGERPRKPYTTETESYTDPSLDDPAAPEQRKDARKGPIA